MKIICDCGNKINVPLANEGEKFNMSYENKQKFDNFSFTHLAGGAGALCCNQCGRTIRWGY